MLAHASPATVAPIGALALGILRGRNTPLILGGPQRRCRVRQLRQRSRFGEWLLRRGTDVQPAAIPGNFKTLCQSGPAQTRKTSFPEARTTPFGHPPRLEPFKKFARILRGHLDRILSWTITASSTVPSQV